MMQGQEARNQDQARNQLRVNFRFFVTTRKKQAEEQRLLTEKAYQDVLDTPIEFVLRGVLSENILGTMKDRGFHLIRDIWPDSKEVLKKIPSYGPVKNERAQEAIDQYF